ncbi:MAG: hypothetical protein VKL41_17540 [Snowella sp.]|nr:hypothetical protein [Snowella sp.]
MTGKVLDNKSAGILVLILPLGVGLVLLYRAWLYILFAIAAAFAWNVWSTYQWEQWSLQVNPIFNQLIQENQGCLTAVDLSLKGNLTPNAARKYLERKADEFGAYRRSYQDKGTVYYFITASTLGKIFDESELEEETAPVLTASDPAVTIAPSIAESEKTIASPFATLAEIKEERQTVPEAIAEITPITEAEKTLEPIEETVNEVIATESATAQANNNALTLIQSDLAKRLDTTSSTIARRKTEPDFADWSLSKDPDGVAWSYDPETKLFIAIA